MKQKAFTLMELMIVIVIIGILSAVGMVMFGGQAEKAKVNVTKANLATVKKYIKVELMMCNNSLSDYMLDYITCPIAHPNDFIAGMGSACRSSKGIFYDMKNPYKPTDSACRINTTLTNDTDLGYINWSKKNDTDVILSSCWKTPCNNTSNYEEITINVKQ